MSWLEFVARLVDSVVWPVVVLVALIVLRRPIARLLTDRPPKRVKAGPLEVEWTREIAEAETELSATGAPLPAGTTAESSIVAELTAEARKAPAVAVLEAHAVVERELRTLLEMKGQPGDERSKAGALGLARLAPNAASSLKRPCAPFKE